MANPLRRSRRQRKSCPASAETIALALGKFDRERLAEDLSAKHRLILGLEEMLGSHFSWLYAKDEFQKHAYSPRKIREILPRLQACATSFSDGQPNDVCKLPFICPFCARSRAEGFSRLYRRMAHARLKKNRWINVLFGAVLGPLIHEDNVLDTLLELQQYVTEVRESIRWQANNDRRRFGTAALSSVYQLDFFVHFNRRVTTRGFRFQPHLHYVAQMTDPRSPLDLIEKYLEAKAHKFDFRLASREVIRVDQGRQTKQSHSAERLAHIGRYCGFFVKPYVETEVRIASIAGLPKRFEQFKRKNAQREEEVLTVPYPHKNPIGDHNARFDPESRLWIPLPKR
ncbi:hypothetical protein [Candidatus Laterigemmans baculatus]|uniref:hypothetical protein n=1 Tax=Candidatus Laterigemmans baculatus TaxID=2770505 RepID=UPI0013D9512A|nr:hypothetical protein [Candidatus Laterigemmans baculatus]